MTRFANSARWCLVLLVALFLCVSAKAQTYIGGAISVSSTTASSTCAVTYSPTAGNTVIGWAAGVGVDVSSVTDNATGGSTTWSRLTPVNNHTVTGSLWGTPASGAGGVNSGVTTITFHMASSTRRSCGVVEFSGVAAYGNSDGTATASSNAPQDSLTTQDNNNFVVVGMSREGTSTWSTHTGVGTLRESLAGGGSTTPGIGISTNSSATPASVTAGATISSSGTWIASAIELRSNAPEAISESVGPASDGSGPTVTYQANEGVSETLSESDSCLVCKNPIGFTEGNVTVDSVTGIRGVIASMSETLTESDSVTGVNSGGSKTANMTDTVTESDSVSTSHGQSVAMSESSTTTPSVAATYQANEAVSETLTESDSCMATTTVCNPVGFTEGNVTVDSVGTLRNAPANVTETLTENDSSSTARSMHGAVTETLSESDSLAAPRAMHASMTETLTETDGVGYATTGQVDLVDNVTGGSVVVAVSSGHTVDLIETVTESDSLATTRAMHGTPSETLTESDSVGATTGTNFNGAIIETHMTTDTVKAPGNHPDLNETLSESDTCTASRCHPVLITEGNVTVDSLARVPSMPALIENLTERDTITAVRIGNQVAGMFEPGPLTFTTLASDPLNGANQNPLNPANWTIATGGNAIQILSNQATGTADNFNDELYTGITWPNDQWAQFTLGQMSGSQATNASEVDLHLRTAADGASGYWFTIYGDYTDGAVLGVYSLSCTPSCTDKYFWLGQFSAPYFPISPGDVFRFGVVGKNLYVYQNGNLIIGTEDPNSTFTSGGAGISIYGASTATDTSVTGFSGGSVMPVPAIDSASGSVGHFVTMTETDVTAGQVTAVKSFASPIMTDTVSESDSITVVHCIQFPSEDLNESDLIGAVHAAVGNLTETLFTSDQAAEATPNRTVHMTETQTENDLVAGVAQHVRLMVENLSHSDSIATHSSHLAAMTDSVALSDSILAGTTTQYAAAMSDSLTEADSIATVSKHLANMFENLTTHDSVAGPRNVIAVMTDTLTSSDVIVWQPGKGMTETFAHSDQLVVRAQHFAVLTDSVAESDGLLSTKFPQYSAAPIESLAVSDSLGIAVGRQIGMIESFVETDSVAASIPAQFNANLVERLVESDFVIARPPLRRKRFMIVDTP